MWRRIFSVPRNPENSGREKTGGTMEFTIRMTVMRERRGWILNFPAFELQPNFIG